MSSVGIIKNLQPVNYSWSYMTLYFIFLILEKREHKLELNM